MGCFVLSVNYQATFEFAETELKIGNRILVDLWLVYGKAKKITYRQKYADLEKYKETYEKTGHKVEIYRFTTPEQEQEMAARIELRGGAEVLNAA